MITKRIFFAAAFFASSLLGTPASRACAAEDADFLIHVRLIWGTNGSKPDPKKGEEPLRDVEPELTKRLKRVLKWKHYYEVKKKKIPVAVGELKTCRIDEPCEIHIFNRGKSILEIRLIGEGTRVVKHTQFVTRGEPIVLAGPDKNDTAWLVVLTPE